MFEVVLSLCLLGILLPSLISYVKSTLVQSIRMREDIICYELADEALAEFLSDIVMHTYTYKDFENGVSQELQLGVFTIRKLSKKVTMETEEKEPKDAMMAAVVVTVCPRTRQDHFVMRSTKICLCRGSA